MAFVARRSSDGTVVDRQQVSSRGSVRPLSQSDISDEDSESLLGYTNRTYGAPTVRYVGQGDDRDALESQTETKTDFEDADNLQFEDSLEEHADISDSETDSILSFCKELEEEEANDALLSGMVSFAGGEPKAMDEADAEVVDQRGMKQEDEAAATDTETVMNVDHDVQSLSSFASCTPTVTQRGEDVDNLDNISGRTFFKQDELDSISTRTFFKEDKLDALSSRTFHKKASLKDKRKHTPSSLEADLGQLSSRTYDLSNSGSNRNHDGSSMSTCSWSDMYRGALQPCDGRSEIPTLSLASGASETSTYCKQLEERQSAESFEKWKKRKAAQKQKDLLAAKLERQKREAEAAKRQVLAQEHFEKWRRRKEQQQQQQQQQQQKPKMKASAASPPGSGSVSGSGVGPAKKVLPPEMTQKRLQEWERVKKEQQQLERERLRRLQSNKQKLEDERRQLSQGAWQNWMKQVDKRAKPVPLNQGFDTLRGTISNIYINPVQWVSNIDPQDAGRSR
ncbi:titin homolog [Drosophila yakuba]|uniref:Coiled-coil domain-containing protein n=1 Tax=Drosophila yakuba TaxID=7245 RepID=B4P044_DROYA|nr:titin homolog [Drosophila yakuba]EDW88909.1 uncharacterized protein Dyak_GE25537 [Drosophila yakuba]